MRKKKANGGLRHHFKRNDVINEVEEKKKKYVRFWTLIAQYIKPFDGLTILYQKFKPSIPIFNYIVKYEIF